MHDFFCTSADDMNFKVLADKVRYLKEGVGHMSKVLEDMRRETARIQETRTLANDVRTIMRKLKYTVEQAMDFLEVPQNRREAVAGLVEGA